MFLSNLSTVVFSVLKFVSLATSLSAILLNISKSTGTVSNLPAPKISTFVFKLFKLLEH